MKVKQIGLFLLILCMGVFTACSSDDDDNKEPETIDYADQAKGTYKGDLLVEIPDQPEFESKSTISLTRTDVNKIKLELKDFSFGDIPLGDIVIKDVPTSKKGDNIVLEETLANLTLMEGITAKAKLSGTVKGDKVDLKIDITEATMVGSLSVAFTGTKEAK